MRIKIFEKGNIINDIPCHKLELTLPNFYIKNETISFGFNSCFYLRKNEEGFTISVQLFGIGFVYVKKWSY